VNAREELLLSMLSARGAQWDVASGSRAEGFNAALDVVEEWRGMYAAPPSTTPLAPPPEDARCDEASVPEQT